MKALAALSTAASVVLAIFLAGLAVQVSRLEDEVELQSAVLGSIHLSSDLQSALNDDINEVRMSVIDAHARLDAMSEGGNF